MERRFADYGCFFRDERGLETVEYAVIAGLTVVAAISVLTVLGLWACRQFNIVNGKVGE